MPKTAREMSVPGRDTQPLVSVVTPVYNGAKYLEELILSVKEQDYPNIEHIVIDDGSTDGGATVEILKRYPHLRWWTRPNKGQYPTMNEGLAACKGELINVICADDKYASDTVVSDVVKVMLAHPQYDAYYGGIMDIDENGRLCDKQPPSSGPIWLFPYYPTVGHCSLFIRRDVVFKKDLWFDETFPHDGDCVWILEMIKKGCRFKHIREIFALYRRHPQQVSQDVKPERWLERQRFLKKYPINPVIYYLVQKGATLMKATGFLRRKGPCALLQECIRRVCKGNKQSKHNI
jgi:glycosyltransferase involved in cell wall biosynthesis